MRRSASVMFVFHAVKLRNAFFAAHRFFKAATIAALPAFAEFAFRRFRLSNWRWRNSGA
jgi:hypothetical protein